MPVSCIAWSGLWRDGTLNIDALLSCRSDRKRLIVGVVVVYSQPVAGIEEQRERSRSINREPRDGPAEDDVDGVLLPVEVLHRRVYDRTSAVVQLPMSFYRDATASIPAVARKVKLELELADADLIKRAANQKRECKIGWNSVHTGCRGLTSHKISCREPSVHAT